MNYIVLGFVVATILMYVIAFAVSPDSVREGLKISYDIFVDPNIGLIPLIITATLIAGLVQAVIPKEVIANLLGKEAGLRGIALGSLLGSVVPGGPYVVFPLLGGLYRAGAGVGTVIAFVTAWALISLSRIPMEIPFLGIKIVALRLALSLILPIVLGLLGEMIFSKL